MPVQALVQPHQYRVLLLVSFKTYYCAHQNNYYVIVFMLALCVLFAGSSGNRTVTDDGGSAEDGQ